MRIRAQAECPLTRAPATLLTALLVLGIATGIAYAYWPRFHLFTLVVTGRSPVCPLRLALDSHAHVDRLKEIKDRILVGSHLTAERDRLELWQTPKGPYWIPKGNRYSNALER